MASGAIHVDALLRDHLRESVAGIGARRAEIERRRAENTRRTAEPPKSTERAPVPERILARVGTWPAAG